MRPPKKSSSVTRKTHIPSAEASFCCSMEAKWCWRPRGDAGPADSGGAALAKGLDLLVRVRVGGFRHDGGHLDVVRRRRRRRLPLEPGRTPGIGRCVLPVAHEPEEID